MISLDNLTVSYGGWTLFDNISFLINPKDRIGLVGRNGAGKTTLLRIITGEQQPTSGSVTLNGDCTIGYLPQTMRVADTTTLVEETAKAFEEVLRLEAEIEHLTREIAERTDYESDGYAQLLHRLNDAQDHYHILGGETRDADIEKTLLGLGFKREDFGRPTSEFSGGWRMRIELAKLLLRRPSIFLLDEPTNHLDMRSKDVLKDALREFDGTVIVVSHDREFLDGLVDKVYEFGNQKVVEHLGGIYNFLEHKKMDSLRELERSTGTSTSMSGTGEAQVSHNKLSYEARKELSKVIKKAEKAVAEAEARISELENGIAVIEAKLATPEGASDASLYGEYSALKKELSDAMDLWTERTMELEELNTQDS